MRGLKDRQVDIERTLCVLIGMAPDAVAYEVLECQIYGHPRGGGKERRMLGRQEVREILDSMVSRGIVRQVELIVVERLGEHAAFQAAGPWCAVIGYELVKGGGP